MYLPVGPLKGGLLLGSLLAVLLGSPGELVAHSSNRRRINALEMKFRKKNAVFAQELSALKDEQVRLEEAREEQRALGEHLRARMKSIEDSVETGLEAIRDTLARETDKRLGDLELRLSKGSKEMANLRKVLKGFEESLNTYRESLESFSKKVEKGLSSLKERVLRLEGQQEKDRKELLSRVDSLLQVVDQENKKLRSAISSVSRQQSTPVLHVVKAGENLWTIARKYNMSTKALLRANDSLESVGSVIHPGDELIIPAPTEE